MMSQGRITEQTGTHWMRSMDTYLVAYDICDPKRLRKVAHTCEDFGYPAADTPSSFADCRPRTLFG